jgi:hypothetical protein
LSCKHIPIDNLRACVITIPGTRREFCGQLHKFMASLTEAVNQKKGHTVLYLPEETVEDVEKVSLCTRKWLLTS